MATENSTTAAAVPSQRYEPNRTLGRSGYVASASDRLADSLRHLDALLCVMNAAETDDQGLTGFQRLNECIQQAALDLASRLAHQAHEAHEELLMQQVAARPALKSQPA